MSKFYAVAKGKNIGIFKTWDDCRLNTSGFSGAIFKSFTNQLDAENFILNNGGNINNNNINNNNINNNNINNNNINNNNINNNNINNNIINNNNINNNNITNNNINNNNINNTIIPTSIPTSIPHSIPTNQNKLYKLYSDGGSRNNGTKFSIAGAGCLLKDSKDNIVFKKFMYLGSETNNIAEYTGLKIGLEEAIKMNVKHVECFTDSNLVVQQLNGNFKVNNNNIKVLYNDIKTNLIPKFEYIKFIHILRKYNSEADTLANIAMDTKTSNILYI